MRPPALPHLALLVSAGGLIYGGLLFLFARPVLIESINLIRNRHG
jgi:hypothetical protein